MYNRKGNTIVVSLLVVVFVVAPWLHGLDLIWEQLTIAGTALLLASWQTLTLSAPHSPNEKRAMWLWLLWIAYCALYLIPLPAGVITFLSPQTIVWYDTYAHHAQPYLTVYWQASLIEWIKILGLGCLFFALIHYLRRPQTIYILMGLLLFGALLTALYSVVNFATAGAYEWVDAVPPWTFSWKNGIRGTFSYKNQYAVYIALACLIVIGLLCDGKYLKMPKWLIVTLILCLCLLGYTLFNTSSRGALVSLIAGMGLTVCIQVVRAPNLLKRWLTGKTIAVTVLISLMLGAGFAQSSIYQRFSKEKLDDNGRIELRDTAFAVFKDHPVVGTGLGTYPYIQHVYKTMLLGNTKMSKRAHNDYLETMATTGLMGFLFLSMSIGFLWLMLFRHTHTRMYGALFACRAGVMTYLFQASFDTNAGIYFLPIVFVTLLTMGFVITERFNIKDRASRTALQKQ
ncbi:O-antigen ligase family protein [Alteromonas sp. C1M14]|uniref:O-antigen ligase family protein n=1 Tax=Alteromonas sp. C1M14 TaxID=2841567 RepID=UPI001C08CDFA|nr:O-antigen ligase family protein [Alteromonas sp. C1M14]MBU2977711.1 O-antigen ligase family protein [Alteromonas sp. C1M14]